MVNAPARAISRASRGSAVVRWRQATSGSYARPVTVIVMPMDERYCAQRPSAVSSTVAAMTRVVPASCQGVGKSPKSGMASR